MNTPSFLRLSTAVLIATSATIAHAQAPAVPAAPTPTIWRFMGIPQGIQKIRDVTVNRRGNFPGLERKPPVKRIGDPANLESDNPAIKAAAEIKQAEDMKMQKIKAIKFLATMGCGCYDKEGKITDALLAAMDDCTPDVRLAAIEAIADSANGECCKSCGSTSCCSEKVTKRLSEIAYERDDSGCMLEPNAEVREAAAKALCVCCPNRATGPIEEDVPEVDVPELPQPIPGETEDEVEAIEGEGGAATVELDSETTSIGSGVPAVALRPAPREERLISPSHQTSPLLDPPSEPATEDPIQLQPMPISLEAAENAASQSDQSESTAKSDIEVGQLRMIGGMAIQPVTIAPVSAIEDSVTKSNPVQANVGRQDRAVGFSISDTPQAPSVYDRSATTSPTLAPRPKPVALPIERESKAEVRSVPRSVPLIDKKPATPQKSQAIVVGVDHRTGKVALRSGQPMRVGASVTVYHSYLTGERLVGHLLIQSVKGAQAVAVATDRAGLEHIESGDRAVCF
ncbi:hypothetical protein [Roseiconus lacunae]|uniref:hypothetical protein n=1 Tax=Roseiconus lacunae TaxID=2605694 RepID=UPI001E46FCB9|nr:hypothetical protein [Roseiconus lacunae]MCD0459316.1 hypothetical protein [Roseiconus lacunae]